MSAIALVSVIEVQRTEIFVGRIAPVKRKVQLTEILLPKNYIHG
jgi:hypothetical protein